MNELEENHQSNKRRRLEEQPSSPLRITDLPDVLLKVCFSFLGPGNFYFIATTCKRFKQIYPFRKRTTWKSGAASISCFESCIHDSVSTGAVRNKDAVTMLLRAAASIRNVPVLQKLLIWYPCRCDQEDFVSAGTRGDLAVLQCAARNNQDPVTSSLCENAAKNGHVHILDWIAKHQHISHYNCAQCAAEGGQVSVFEWMKNRDMIAQIDGQGRGCDSKRPKMGIIMF